MRPPWRGGPTSITLVRHGESIGNVADARANAEHAELLELDLRDADVPLSDNGRAQAGALRRWLDENDQERPTVVVSSPYRRAAETAELVVAGLDVEVELDERLRERTLGSFDGLTSLGIGARFPEEAERRKRTGKFYYQPPGGESWADVALRIRSFLRDLAETADGQRVWLFTHEAVVMVHRYLLEGLTEQQILEVDRGMRLPNASRTVFERDDSGYRMVTFGDATPIEPTEAVITHESAPDDKEPLR